MQIDFLQKQMAGWSVGHTCLFFSQVDSTMSVAHELARDHPGGLVIVADEQTAGRGRQQRAWIAPPGQGLLCSVLVKSPLVLTDPGQLPMVGGLAALRSVGDLHPDLRSRLSLKWPNDLMVSGIGAGGTGMGKLGGLLVEGQFVGTELTHGVLGIGINVNQTAEELPQIDPAKAPAISLRQILGQVSQREALLREICRHLSHLLDPASAPTHGALHLAWQQELSTLGQEVTVQSRFPGSPTISGRALRTTDRGDLILLDARGEEIAVQAGDVTGV